MTIGKIMTQFNYALEDFNSQFDYDFSVDDFVIQGIDIGPDREKVFEEFCVKHFPHRLSDDYKNIDYYSFIASAFTGKTRDDKNGILLRTDISVSNHEMYHIFLHEIAHIYCVHHELAGKNFYDTYCINYANDNITDGQINFGYAVWREVIAEIISAECDDGCNRYYLHEKDNLISHCKSEMTGKDKRIALYKIIVEVMLSIDVVEVDDWYQAENVIKKSGFFENPLFMEVFGIVFNHLKSSFVEIDIDFIGELGVLCLEIAADFDTSLKGRLGI